VQDCQVGQTDQSRHHTHIIIYQVVRFPDGKRLILRRMQRYREATFMPRITDRSKICALLESDRNWAVYALGDLAPDKFRQSIWHATATAIVLLYGGFETPVLFALGEPEEVGPLLNELGPPPKMYLHVRPEILPIVRGQYEVLHDKTMLRMVLDSQLFSPASSEDVVRLSMSDLRALQDLYSDGMQSGEAPEFFVPSMLHEGVYFGVKQGTELISVAGTHFVAPHESVAAIGCVYTRRDYRGHGMATRVTSAVAGELMATSLRTIALNVHESNASAMRVYEKLGFATYCKFKEGLATQHDP
jgi:ribosomal protein S18 acetylase RimI-like enzyme